MLDESEGSRPAVRELSYYALSAAVTAAILVAVYDLRHADLSVPLYYGSHGDTWSLLTWVKTIQETGWIHVNDRLGAPGVMDLYDISSLNDLGWLTLKVLIALTGDPAAALNLYFLLGFFLSGWTCLFVLRRFGIWGPIALGAGLLFAFQPLHFHRGTWHAELAFYPAIPLAVLLCLWICERRPIFVRGARRGECRSLARAAGAVGICIVTAGFAIYYAWFMGFLLVTSALVVWLRRPRLVPPWDACVCLALLVATVAVQVVPIAAHWRAHGMNTQGVKRSPGDSQHFGLAVPELVLPTLGHRIPKFRVVESRRSIGKGADPMDPQLNARAVLNEKYYNALGVVGSAGFLLLCLILLAPGARWVSRIKPVADLSKLNVAAVLLGSGFGLLAEAVVPRIRAYNRIAIYIAFFSLFAVAVVAQRLKPLPGSSARSRAWFLFAVVAVTVLGLLDEIPGVVTPVHCEDQEAYAAEADYVRKLEAMVERGARIFELPYSHYPEGSWGYDHLKLYLHSRHIRLGFGAIRGSKSDLWQKEVSKKPLSTMLEDLRRAGFSGIHVDYGVLGSHPETSDTQDDVLRKDVLERELGPPDLLGNHGLWAFYRIPGLGGRGTTSSE